MAIDIGLGELVGSQSPEWIASIRGVLPGDGGVEATQQDLGSIRSRAGVAGKRRAIGHRAGEGHCRPASRVRAAGSVACDGLTGMSAAFVVRSEPGVGKSAVLDDRVANAAVCEAQHDVADQPAASSWR